MGELLSENNATSRCYDNISQAKYYVPPHPLKNLLTRVYQNESVAHERTVDASHKDLLLLPQTVRHHQDPAR